MARKIKAKLVMKLRDQGVPRRAIASTWHMSMESNARAEGFFGLRKREFFHGRDWSGRGLAEFMAELDGWMRRFREGRISQALGWLTPDEHRLSLGYTAQEQENVRSPNSVRLKSFQLACARVC